MDSPPPSFPLELRLSQTSIDFGTDPVCDSVIFTLRFNGPAYGLNFDQYLSVEQLADTLSIDSAYYARDLPATVPVNLAIPEGQPVQMHPSQSVIIGSDTLSARFHIPLDPAFGQSLIDADSSVYATNEAWRAHFKGLQVRSQSGGGGIVCLEPNAGISYMTLHYHNTEDTTSYNFIINSNAARVGHFQHSWPPEFGRLNDSLATDMAERVALVGAAGSYLRLDLSGLDSLNAADGTVINRAEIVLPVEDLPSNLPRPSTLTAFMKGVNGGLELTPEAGRRGHLWRHLRPRSERLCPQPSGLRAATPEWRRAGRTSTSTPSFPLWPWSRSCFGPQSLPRRRVHVTRSE